MVGEEIYPQGGSVVEEMVNEEDIDRGTIDSRAKWTLQERVRMEIKGPWRENGPCKGNQELDWCEVHPCYEGLSHWRADGTESERRK